MAQKEKIQTILSQAQQLYGKQQYADAEALYCEALTLDSVCREALEGLLAICLQARRSDDAQHHLQQLVAAYPEEPGYCDQLANVLERRGELEAAIACYRRLLSENPAFAASRYNLARLLKRAGHYEQALAEYNTALELGITQPEEVYSNISVILSDLHRDEEALAALQQALALKPGYAPAMYNLALLHEERGNWQDARDLLQGILAQDPSHYDALVRLANGQTTDNSSDPIIKKLTRALRRGTLDDPTRENLHFALGKVCDDCRQYAEAFEHYVKGNQYSRQRAGSYDREGQKALTNELIATFSPEWFDRIEPLSDATPIFICGMFRSGSTLVEQILAAHPGVTAGGEINYFNLQAKKTLQPFPSSLRSIDHVRLIALGAGYLEYLSQTFPDCQRVTNKRPDNFVYLGLIKALFPNARIVNTSRNPLDNCLSVFFQQIESQQAYANDILDIGHFYLQYRRLMDHWQRMFADSILNIAYDQLVCDPRLEIENILDFLGLDWHEGCVNFHEVDNRVRTASAQQVREPLYQKSSGRWQNYARQLEPLRLYLEKTSEG
ncbi:MAG: tetratricopeptide repeat-containing sulfotransferase family protein [Pseudomonadales bacterium]